MAYTWQDVLLGIDMNAEAKREKKEMKAIQEKQTDEDWWMSVGGFVAGGLCSLVWGPGGYAVCSNIAEYGIDQLFDWEKETLTPGKFYRDDELEYNESIKDAADQQTLTQLAGTLVDLGTAYVQSGGPTAEPGEWDPTTYGSGESEWSWFGSGTPESGTPGSTVEWTDEFGNEFWDVTDPVNYIPESEDYVAGFFEGGLWEGIRRGGSLLGGTPGTVSQVATSLNKEKQ